MNRWTLADLDEQSSRTVIVTGASSGLGLIVARELDAAGARVVLAVRNVAKGREAAAGMSGRTEVRELDVSDLGSVRRFAAAWDEPVYVLVNNAGIMEVPLRRTADGFESQLATNYLGPFVLTGLLLGHITGRVVTVASQLHRMGTVHLDDLNYTDRPYKASTAYEDSKLAGVLFSLELQRRLDAAGSPVRAVVAHPGIASTNLARHATSGRVTHALRFLFNDPATGALSILYAATRTCPAAPTSGPRGPAGLKGHSAPAGPPPPAATPTSPGDSGRRPKPSWPRPTIQRRHEPGTAAQIRGLGCRAAARAHERRAGLPAREIAVALVDARVAVVI